LYNENNGGLGGPDPTPELRARISASVKNALKNADMSFYSNPEYRAKLSKSVSESYTDELREKRANSTVEQWARWREQKALVEPDRAYIIYKEAGDRARRKGDHEHASELYQHAERYRKAS